MRSDTLSRLALTIALATALSSFCIAQEPPEQIPDARLAAIPADERVVILRELLSSNSPTDRTRAARQTKANWDLALLGELETQLAREKNPATKQALKTTVDELRLYSKILLPEEELAGFQAPPVDREQALKQLGFGPVDLRVEARDAQGKPVPNARCFAYSRDYCLRSPTTGFAMSDESGAINLKLARGVWSVVVISALEFQDNRSNRGLFLKASNVELKKPRQTLRLKPDAELVVNFGARKELNAAAIHVIDRLQGHQIKFPAMGAAKGRFVLKATSGVTLAVLAQGTCEDGSAWSVFDSDVTAPAKLDWRPTGPQATKVVFKRPTHLKDIKSVTLIVHRFWHEPTPLIIEDLDLGSTVYLSPGTVELRYTVAADDNRYEYSPRQYELMAGQTLSLTADSPTTASIFHQHYPFFYGEMKRVLAAGLIARDANGHLLNRVLNADGKPSSLSLTARLDGEEIGRATSARGRLIQKIAQDVDGEILPRLLYEIAAPLGPGVPSSLPGCDWTMIETEHFTVYAAPMLVDRASLLAKGIEALYDELSELKGEGPKWKRTGLLMRTIMPPTTGASATKRGVLMPYIYLLSGRWLNIESIKKLPHELEHMFGFGHEDFMGIWANRLYGRMCSAETPAIMTGPPPNAAMQENVLALMRGDVGVKPSAVPWIIYGKCGIAPFRGYQEVKQEWPDALQSQGATDEETYCAILSECAQQDFRPLYALVDATIRPDEYAEAQETIARLRSERTEIAATDDSNTTGASAAFQIPMAKLNAAIKQAKEAGGEEGVKILLEAKPVVAEFSRNRIRCRQYMRLGAVFMELDAEAEACEAFRDVQREAALVGREYLNHCRRLAVIGLTGRPPGLGHM